jgi:transcriptional regulator with XRE-family HTH domain
MARGWTVNDLAERTGVTDKTVRKVERGDLSVAIGTVFDCAVLVGVPLYYEDERRLAAEADRARPALIGRRVRRAAEPEVDLDF